MGAVNHPAVLPGLRMSEVPMSLCYQFVTGHRANLSPAPSITWKEGKRSWLPQPDALFFVCIQLVLLMWRCPSGRDAGVPSSVL